MNTWKKRPIAQLRHDTSTKGQNVTIPTANVPVQSGLTSQWVVEGGVLVRHWQIQKGCTSAA